MSDHHIAVQMDDLKETQRDRSKSKSKSRDGTPTGSPRPRRRVARAVSEAEDDNDDERPDVFNTEQGVDDGLLDIDQTNKQDDPSTTPNGGLIPNGTNSGLPKPRPKFPSSESDVRRTIMVDGIETQVPDLNAYQHKKTLAQGMMDLALLSANANQLRYVLESYKRHPYFYPSLIFISLSIIFQIAVGVGLILNSRYNIKDERDRCKANRINNNTIIGIFIVTVVNVFISAFGVADAPTGQ